MAVPPADTTQSPQGGDVDKLEEYFGRGLVRALISNWPGFSGKRLISFDKTLISSLTIQNR